MARVTDAYFEERRGEILDAATRVFIRKGYDSATMQDIASEADVAAGSIYRYFPGKAELIAAVSERCCEEDRDLFVHPGDAASPLRALLATGEQVRSQLSTEHKREQCILRLESFLAATRDDTLRDAVHSTFEEVREKIAELFRAAQEAGEVDPTLDPDDLSRAVLAFTHGLSALVVPLGDEAEIDRTWAVIVRLFSSLFLVDPFAEQPGDPDLAEAPPDTST